MAYTGRNPGKISFGSFDMARSPARRNVEADGRHQHHPRVSPQPALARRLRAVEQMVEVVRVGLASATAKRVVAGGKMMEVAQMRITEEERQALAQ